MSASIPSLLADELDTSPEKAQKLLLAMLREVKKRARHEGVRLPELGTFREANGQITFEPSPSLARAVNQRFEGLESEDLGTAPAQESNQQDEDDDGPNTITLGYQDSDWSPLDGDESEDTGDTDDDGDEADTEEFQVPDADEAADTEEFQSPEPADDEPAAPSSEKGSASDEERTTETEELYPLVEDVSDDEAADDASASPDPAPTDSEGSPAARPTSEEEHDSLSGIWDDDEEDEDEPHDTGFDPFDTEPEPRSEPDQTEDPESDSGAESAPPLVDPESADGAEKAVDERTPAEPSDTGSEKSRSTGARVAVSLLVVLLLGGATWYLLGRRGTVQPPRQAFAQLQAQVQPQLQKLSGLMGSSADAPPSASAEVGSNTQTASAEDQSSDAGASPSESTDASPPTDRGLTPSTGGWTIIVASRTQRGPAEALVQKYRTAFADRNLPVGILTSQVNNQTRYRVGVGQFESRSDARRLLDEAEQSLPNGAWPLRLQ